VAVKHGERLGGGCVGSPQPSLHQPHPAWLPEQRNLAGKRLQVLFKLLPKPRLVAYVTSSIKDDATHVTGAIHSTVQRSRAENEQCGGKGVQKCMMELH
jgi:hypothetical protein